MPQTQKLNQTSPSEVHFHLTIKLDRSRTTNKINNKIFMVNKIK